MKKWLAILLLVPTFAFAAGSKYPLDKAEINLNDQASLQRGAQTFMNYCLGCHQMQYQRYQRTFEDIGVPLDIGAQYLQFTGEKVSDYITTPMPQESAATWFGAPPPDLTLVNRVRGADWIYTYLRTFYVDESRPFGVNNLTFENVGMPHVLQGLQGTTRKATEMRMIDGEQKEVNIGLRSDGDGKLTPEEYDQTILDLVNFLAYTGEPARLQAEKIGKGVLIFILIFFVFAYLLKKDYWKDVKK
ncbi:cytochrome c1 [Glaciecola sp. MH2013]|uniref:cytochrome c1 n=1 Tax=Glaciecola sp. MH2013 TaxID=2785524 RepID=UPI0018A10457|nr:cytochrome c1 [Glaciecola sp. MH2013]MBF7075053.1 cytochrome c1 [Glaciecola sp. MH2013]